MTPALAAASLTVALLAFALSVASLTWQAVTFFLSGSRLSCELRMGAAHPLTRKWMTQPATGWDGLTPQMVSQGFTEERVVFIVVRNKGRAPASVDALHLVSNTGQTFGQTGTEPWEEKLPARLEPEASGMWSFSADLLSDAVALIQSAPEIASRASGGVLEMRVEVEAGSGKKVQSKQFLKYPCARKRAPPEGSRGALGWWRSGRWLPNPCRRCRSRVAVDLADAGQVATEAR
jgi:hypothetical protein